MLGTAFAAAPTPFVSSRTICAQRFSTLRLEGFEHLREGPFPFEIGYAFCVPPAQAPEKSGWQPQEVSLLLPGRPYGGLHHPCHCHQWPDGLEAVSLESISTSTCTIYYLGTAAMQGHGSCRRTAAAVRLCTCRSTG